jgi:3-hydroxyisobutyrate dehydrogenase
MERLGFIGTGAMGKPMCGNLLRHGFALTVHDRRPEATRELVAAGAIWAGSGRAVAAASDIVITMLPDSPQVEEAILGPEGVLEGAREGMAVVDMSTVAPATSRRAAAACAAHGVAFLDAPASGGVPGAQAGALTIIAGGEVATFERLRSVFAAMGAPDNIIHVGPAGTGTVVKLVNQHILGVVAAATLEALLVGARAGADVETMARVIGASSGANWPLANVIPRRAFSGTFEAGFTLDLLAKDLRLAMDLAAEAQVPATLLATARTMYSTAQEQGYGPSDYTAVVRPLEEAAGVELRVTRCEV